MPIAVPATVAKESRSAHARLGTVMPIFKSAIGLVCSACGSLSGNVNALAGPVFSRNPKFAGVLTVLGLGGYCDPAA
jgi:DNA-binding IclR family transcriptional regulator